MIGTGATEPPRAAASPTRWPLRAFFSVLLFFLSFVLSNFFVLATPRLLPVFAEVVCPDGTVAARTRVVTVASGTRGKRSLHWNLECRLRDGRQVPVSLVAEVGLGWLLFVGGGGLVVLTAGAIEKVLEARMPRGHR